MPSIITKPFSRTSSARALSSALARHEVVGRQHARPLIDNGADALPNHLDVERVDRLIVALAARQQGHLRRAEVEIVERDDLRLQAELFKVVAQQVRRRRFSAGGGAGEHADLRRAVMGEDIARNIAQVFAIAVLHLIDHDLRARERRVVDLLEVVDVFNVSACEIAHIACRYLPFSSGSPRSG
jgi:hypothetical protein